MFASKKIHSYRWKKAPHQPITKLYGKPRDSVAEEQGKLWEGRRWKIDSRSDSDRDSEFSELRDLSLLECLECIVRVLCSVVCLVCSGVIFLFCECGAGRQGVRES